MNAPIDQKRKAKFGEIMRRMRRPDVTARIRIDLAAHSDAYCAARGIRPAREDWAANETVELPAVEFRRNVLVAAAERVGRG